MKVYADKEVWLVTGSQNLYGLAVLEQVAQDSAKIAAGLDSAPQIPVRIVAKDTVKTPSEILAVCQEANSAPQCVGVILWMHTFSPAKMWISGLQVLSKPFLHLHTQFNAALPWDSINMDYMNLHQSAHGDREFGYIGARMRLERRVVVGHWDSESVKNQIDSWSRVAVAWHESQNLRVARFGDNMRQVAVTEGDKVAAQLAFGYEVHGYGLGDLAEVCNAVSSGDIDAQLDLYRQEYEVSEALLKDAHQLTCLQNEARLELGMRRFLDDGGFKAFTNTFEDLHGITNLPGLATQRLMQEGYGYGGEGDWKTAALVRITKVMAQGRAGGTSFMEDYTYNFGDQTLVLGAHMLEVCPTIAAAKPRVQVSLHTIGCRADIARLIFTGQPGPALNITCVDMGNRLRLLVNEVNTVEPPKETPNLPVAKALWEPMPNMEVGAAAWILGGGAHHSAYSQAVTLDQVEDFAEMAGVELVVIDKDTRLRDLKQQLRHNAAYYHLKQGV